MKKKWLEHKDKLINAAKFMILTAVMIMGFWVIYATVWFLIGLPETNWAMWILFALSMGSEWLYIKWLMN